MTHPKVSSTGDSYSLSFSMHFQELVAESLSRVGVISISSLVCRDLKQKIFNVPYSWGSKGKKRGHF